MEKMQESIAATWAWLSSPAFPGSCNLQTQTENGPVLGAFFGLRECATSSIGRDVCMCARAIRGSTDQFNDTVQAAA